MFLNNILFSMNILSLDNLRFEHCVFVVTNYSQLVYKFMYTRSLCLQLVYKFKFYCLPNSLRYNNLTKFRYISVFPQCTSIRYIFLGYFWNFWRNKTSKSYHLYAVNFKRDEHQNFGINAHSVCTSKYIRPKYFSHARS